MSEILKALSSEVSLTIIIVNCGMASKVLKEAKKQGVTGGTILIGKGIAGNTFSKILGMDETKKEIVLMVIDRKIENYIHEFIAEKFSLRKKNRGILFSIDLGRVSGVKPVEASKIIDDKIVRAGEIKLDNKNNKNKYEAIFVIVNRGDAKTVVNTAMENGATGGTILHGRGAGIYENSSLFSMAIEPEKEIILFLVEREKADNIIKVIEKTMEIEEPGKGIIFTVPVNKAEGLYEKN